MDIKNDHDFSLFPFSPLFAPSRALNPVDLRAHIANFLWPFLLWPQIGPCMHMVYVVELQR